MENLQKLNLLECDTNTVYELEVTPEIYARATMDMVFATNLLKRSVHEVNIEKKREETREKHHQEKIAAMNRLTDVVAQLVKQTQKED
ncbi:unnamed protein product [Euphydryas editha]|uniref:Uncharacterized protein n=1 Tax=Euphydryas editha TaxID=104508 RepID=A0AAU9U5H1_EUPED|nr:unnamed protein product [Euphydryas editha]